jgi:hypothetical protein
MDTISDAGGEEEEEEVDVTGDTSGDADFVIVEPDDEHDAAAGGMEWPELDGRDPERDGYWLDDDGGGGRRQRHLPDIPAPEPHVVDVDADGDVDGDGGVVDVDDDDDGDVDVGGDKEDVDSHLATTDEGTESASARDPYSPAKSVWSEGDPEAEADRVVG